VPAQEIGERLRAVRWQRGWTLHDVAARSDNLFRVTTLRSYERGDRQISVVRLLMLAELYEVPPAELLPPDALEVDEDSFATAHGDP
jgi:transcriptional regulator with XRE-family HTH domain